MNAPIIVARRATSSICFSCRRSLLRQFSATRRVALPAEFQSYRLNPQPPSPPRSAGGPDTSITHPIEPPVPLPQVHETRPPRTTAGPGSDATSVREQVAQRSAPAFAQQQQQQGKEGTAPAQEAQLEQQPQESPAPSPSSRTPAPPSTTTTAAAPAPGAAAAAPKARPRSKLRAPRKAAMRLTPAAVAHLQALLDQPEPKLIKVGVRNRGCSGLAYHLEFVDRAGAFDETVEQDGVRVLIDSKALFSIIGSEMDWVEDKLNQRFVFRNPNISESFLLPPSLFPPGR